MSKTTTETILELAVYAAQQGIIITEVKTSLPFEGITSFYGPYGKIKILFEEPAQE